MSDSGSASSSMAGVGETRMLERRVSNNRGDLNGDQQLNYFIAWFNTWTELQKADFVPILAGKMSAVNNGKANDVNGLAESFDGLSWDNKRPPSLFSCQVKLFRDWFGSWSDDQKNYLVMRLRDLDADFYERYEDHLAGGGKTVAKDYFEPGIPKELVRHSSVIKEEDAEAEDEDAAAKNGLSSISED